MPWFFFAVVFRYNLNKGFLSKEKHYLIIIRNIKVIVFAARQSPNVSSNTVWQMQMIRLQQSRMLNAPFSESTVLIMATGILPLSFLHWSVWLLHNQL